MRADDDGASFGEGILTGHGERTWMKLGLHQMMEEFGFPLANEIRDHVGELMD